MPKTQFTQKRNKFWELNVVDSIAQKKHNLSEKMKYDGMVQRELADIFVYHHPMNALVMFKMFILWLVRKLK